jgi:hypothetical protein
MVDEGKPPVPRFKNRREMLYFALWRIHQTRRYWLLPVLVLVAVLGLLVNVFTGYNVLPAIYSLIP